MRYSDLFTPRDSHNYRVFSYWYVGSMLLFVTATMLIDAKLIPNAVGWAMTAVVIVLMLFSFKSYVYFLRNADELLRKVHLEALAIAFGIGTIAMMGYRLCERLGAPKLDINDPFLVMVVGWAFAQFWAMRRYGSEESA